MNTNVVYSTTHLIILIWHALKIAVCMLVNTVFAEGRFPANDGKLRSQSLAETLSRHEPEPLPGL